MADRQRAEMKWRSIFENAVEGIFQTTVEGKFLAANPALARICGYETIQELTQQLADVGQLYQNPQRRSEFVQRLENDELVTDFESKIQRADGEVVWISPRKWPRR